MSSPPDGRPAMSMPVSIALLGAGLIGRRHAELILAEPEARLHAIVDPSEGGRAYAEAKGLRWFPTPEAMLAAGKPDGVLVATPNALHVEHGLLAISAGLPVLVEKPLAADLAGARQLVQAAAKAGLPLLTGHHRRHNPLIARAKAMIEAGRLGRIVSVHGFFWLLKPDSYFDVEWRRQPGAGPVLINLSHDIDLLRHLCGEIVEVRAMQNNAVRGFPVDETSVVLLRFASGALGTVNISDTITAPWSWEQGAAENPVYPPARQNCYFIGGTEASLAIPRLELWRNEGRRGWWEPLVAEQHVAPPADPLPLQIRQFVRVIRGVEEPLVPGLEGMRTMAVIDAVRRAAASGEAVRLDEGAGA